ncbi:hypothetical protein HaLaN_17374 [Haematococcus lacustris]|uniref:Uncharacterized protein n=1 Tax=Haematococcus lacustris TaxID=44745 RepID=A0A699ZDT0_HAELA|nr:hypothetical protein HaLaN_17374 [Haematococcus lacustris]
MACGYSQGPGRAGQRPKQGPPHHPTVAGSDPAPPPAPGNSQLRRYFPGGQPIAHHRHPGHLGRGVGTAAAEAVRSPGPGTGAVLQEVRGGHGGGVHGAPWACQAAGGVLWRCWHWHWGRVGY